MPNLFLKIDGIKGASVDSKHKESIELTSYSLGAGSKPDGQSWLGDIQCTAMSSIADPKLLKSCLEHKPEDVIKQVVLTCRAAGSGELDYRTVTLTNCYVHSLVIGSNGKNNTSDSEPTRAKAHESIAFSLSYEKAELVTKEFKTDGSLGGAHKYGYDRRTHKGI